MFVPISVTYFLLGFVGFQIAHFAYVFLFLEHRNKQRNLVAFSLIILAYAGSIFYVLEKDLNGLIIPVIIYIIAISAMVITAYARKGNANPKSYLFVLAGAILFLISDSFLAINKFSQELPFAHLSVMGTYSFAQFGITLGILKLKK